MMLAMGHICRRLPWLAVANALVIGTVAAGTATEGRNQRERVIWTAVESASRADSLPRAKADQPDPRVEHTWWYGRATELNDAFWAACKDPDVEQKLKYYVDQFGSRGGDADLAWLMGCPRILVAGPCRPPEAEVPNNVAYAAGFRAVDETVCRREVERFSGEPKLLDRYYRAVLWAGTLFGSGERHDTEVKLSFGSAERNSLRDHPKDFWRYARDFVLVAHAMNRDDLVSADEQTLVRNHARWAKWMEENRVIDHLRPDARRPVWAFDAGFSYTELPWLNDVPVKPFPDVRRTPRFYFDHLYDDLAISARDPTSPSYAACVEIGKTLQRGDGTRDHKSD